MQHGAYIVGLRDLPDRHSDPTTGFQHAPKRLQCLGETGKEHQAETAQHAREARVRELQPLGIHDLRWCTQTSSPRLGVGGPHHCCGQVDTDDGTCRPRAFGGRKQHGAAAQAASSTR
jgi:hypothetical protein